MQNRRDGVSGHSRRRLSHLQVERDEQITKVHKLETNGMRLGLKMLYLGQLKSEFACLFKKGTFASLVPATRSLLRVCKMQRPAEASEFPSYAACCACA